jgi:Domain of unknown function (DUF4388)
VKLEGSLDAFSLPDIFQLLSFTKKSGGLHLRRATNHGCVYFRDGAVTGASSDDGRQALARRLVATVAIGDADLNAAVERAAVEGVGVARALLDAGAVDLDFLRNLVGEQAVDAVFDLLRWTEGDFSFTVDEPGPDDVGFALGVEPLVNDARSRLESWDHACRVIPSPETVLALPVALREDLQVTRGEWAMLALVDGRRNVADLVGLAGRGDYAVVSQLAALIERGLLSVRTPDAEEGALALARRHAILARLETGSADPVIEVLDVEPTPSIGFAPLPPLFGGPSRTPDRSDPQVTDAVDDAVFAGANIEELSPISTVASVLAAAANGDPSPFARTQAPARSDRADELAPARERPAARADESLAAHLVADTRTAVTPARPEPFMPRRRPEFPDEGPRTAFMRPAASSGGSAALATAETADHAAHIERDPSVNKSLLLRLIAGVRGL